LSSSWASESPGAGSAAVPAASVGGVSPPDGEAQPNGNGSWRRDGAGTLRRGRLSYKPGAPISDPTRRNGCPQLPGRRPALQAIVGFGKIFDCTVARQSVRIVARLNR